MYAPAVAMDVDSQPMLGFDEQRIPALDAEPIGAPDSLGIVMEAAARAEETFELAARHLDPSLVDVLRILGFDENYVTAGGSYLYDAAGRARHSLPSVKP